MLKFLGLSNGTPSDKEVPAWNGVEKKHKALSIAGRACQMDCVRPLVT